MSVTIKTIASTYTITADVIVNRVVNDVTTVVVEQYEYESDTQNKRIIKKYIAEQYKDDKVIDIVNINVTPIRHKSTFEFDCDAATLVSIAQANGIAVIEK